MIVLKDTIKHYLKLIQDDVMEVSTSDKLKNVKDTSFIAKTEEAKAVKKNVLALSKKELDVDMEEQLYFVNKIVSELMNKKSIVMSKDKYKQKIKSIEKTRKIL